MRRPVFSAGVSAYLLALGLIAAAVACFSALHNVLDTSLIALLFLIPVGISAAAWGLGPGVVSAFGAFLGFNYFFIAPYYTFAVHRPSDLVALMVFLIVAVVISQLLGRAQAGLQAATAREKEATQLYEVSTALAGLHDEGAILRILADQLRTTFNSTYLEIEQPEPAAAPISLPVGMSRPARPAELVLPMLAVRGSVGEIRLWRNAGGLSPTEQRLARTFASQGALALERAALRQAEARARILEESDQLKTALLSSVSHELRTPLATIKAAASSLRGGEVSWESSAREELLAAIDDEADHLNMLVGNLLDMSRIESGALKPQRKWNILSEIVHGVLARMRHAAESHRLVVDIPEDLPLVPVDYVQMEQVFTNLISNSIKFAPPNTVVRVQARAQQDGSLLVKVSNEGPTVPDEHLDRIFDKFYRITAADRVTGTGLGLSICRGIVEAHGGRIWAENLPDGFAFNFTLPLGLDGVAAPWLPTEPEDR